LIFAIFLKVKRGFADFFICFLGVSKVEGLEESDFFIVDLLGVKKSRLFRNFFVVVKGGVGVGYGLM
jgi:hypothetical protein